MIQPSDTGQLCPSRSPHPISSAARPSKKPYDRSISDCRKPRIPASMARTVAAILFAVSRSPGDSPSSAAVRS